MAFLPAKDSEPIAGYRLIEKLGVGGYGEVWKVTAPGGLVKAIKIVYGDMSGSRAEQELKALGRIKAVRHPFLLSLERIEIVDSQLCIVTELADGCLSDRFFECRKKGMKGIPRDELLGHLRDAAEALDYMSETHGLQHLDIKPQNLLLVGNRIKVADFGLVKDVVGAGATAPGGVTPVYASPETFDGRVSRYSDQYSLGVVYQEMLTGVRPFPGTTLMQLVAQHVNSPPLLTPLPVGDRAAVAKALAKSPEMRFPSCLKMVDALLGQHGEAAAAPVEPSRRLAAPENEGSAETEPRPASAAADSYFDLNLDTVPKVASSAENDATAAQQLAARSVAAGNAGLRPTLVLGIGGLAAAARRRLKKRLYDKYGAAAETPIFRLLQVDTDRQALRHARLGDAGEALDVTETLLAPLHLPEYYRAESKKLLRWLDRRWFYGIPRSLQTDGLRPLGRLALVDNAADVLTQIREALTQITSAEAVRKTVSVTGAPLRNKTPRVFVVASIAGGAGGGMAVSMAYAVRQTLQELGLSAQGLCGIFLYATSPKPSDQEMARVNAYAALSELEHFSRPDAFYPGDPDWGLQPFAPGQAPFEENYLIHLGEQLGESESQAATETLAEYLFLDLSPNGGAYLDEFRSQTHAPPGEPITFRSFGLSRIGTQGERPMELATQQLCKQLTEKWTAGPGEAESKYLERQAQRQAVALGLAEQPLIEWLNGSVASALGESLESYLPKLLAAAAGAAESDLPQKMLGPIDKMFSAKADAKENVEAGSLPLTTMVGKAAAEHGTAISAALIDWLIQLIETPGKRLRGAQRAAGALQRDLTALANAARARLSQVGIQRLALRRQIETEKPNYKAGGLRWLGIALRGNAPKAEDDLLEYCRLWLHETTEGSSLAVLGVVEHALRAFVQTLGLCRQKLDTFTDFFRPAQKNELPPNAATIPLPQSDETPGVAQIVASSGQDGLPPELVFRFDRSFQHEVLERHGGLWGVLSRDETITRTASDAPQATLASLAEDLQIRSRTAIQAVIKELNAAQLFLQAHGGPEQALPVLLAQAEAARPRLRSRAGWERLVVAAPEGEAGETLTRMLLGALADVSGTVVHTVEEVIISYEAARCPLRDAARTLVGPAEVPLDVVRRVMTRLDVPWKLAHFSPR